MGLNDFVKATVLRKVALYKHLEIFQINFIPEQLYYIHLLRKTLNIKMSNQTTKYQNYNYVPEAMIY